MAAGNGKCSKIRNIVKLRQLLRRWRQKASNRTSGRTPSDVPSGHVAVEVGTSSKRFVVRASYLNHPAFKKLLVEAEEEYGFTSHGPLAIPCNESVFEKTLQFLSSSSSSRFGNLEDFQRHCHVEFIKELDFWPESRPILEGSSEVSAW